MKVLILCGGMGTRLREETEHKPKAMVEVGDKPMLWHIMNHFSSFGFNDFILALGYKGDYIKDYFSKANHNFNIVLADTGLNTTTSGRILACQPHLNSDDNDFIVSYSDGLSDLNIQELCNFHRQHHKIATVVGSHPHSKYGKLHLNDAGLVTRLEEKPLMTDWTNAGYMVYKKEALKYFDPHEMDFNSLDKIARDGQLAMYQHEGFWYAVDTYKELEELNNILKNNGGPWKKINLTFPVKTS